eukprot:TRINITY_DN10237_c0_g1_i1.p1 TRINITY_DN10237_c0_g1~~TRINITY_DN10237_c0_g1_i1.p1  ORF type:complete len:464 (-),score=131.34 TRINITY_DN10237_c0_g1_i1:5-1396(-)
MSTILDSLVQEATTKYQHAMAEGRAPVMREEGLQKALKLYHQALQHSLERETTTKIIRNFGVANSKIVQNMRLFSDKNLTERKLFFALEALKQLSDATTFATKTNATFHLHQTQPPFNTEWFEKVKTFLDEVLMVMHDDFTSSEVKLQVRYGYCVRLIENICIAADNNQLKANWMVKFCTDFFHTAVKMNDKKNFAQALDVLHYCSKLFNECFDVAVSCGDVQVKIEAEDLKERTHILSCVCESSKEISVADRRLQQYINDEFAVDQFWDVVDGYHSAILLTREKDIENEANACSRLGKVYDQVFTHKTKARPYFKRCIELAMSLTPKNFAGYDWFQAAERTLEKYQREDLLEEEKRTAQENKQYYEELKVELEALEIQSKSKTFVLLQFIYKNHPPKQGTFDVKEIEVLGENTDKKTLTKKMRETIVLYHPDKQGGEDKKWRVLCLEITKYLNRHYGGLKIN